MKELLDKIGTYNIFNYLLPGIVFSAFVSNVTQYNLMQKDIIAGAFIYYFIGSVVSRVGSLLIEPFLKRIGFLTFASYSDFVAASKLDPKIELLSEANNMYRTFCALFVCVGTTYIYERAALCLPCLGDALPVVLVVGLLTLFFFSYKKQTAYVTKRIQANK